MAKEKKQRNKFPVIEVPASGHKTWMGGAWCLVWVYTTNGNFLLKGFYSDCEVFIKSQGWKCWAIFNLYHTKSAEKSWNRPTGTYRTIIKTFKCEFKIYTPYRQPKTNKEQKFRVRPENLRLKKLYLKRLPQQFVDFDFEEDIEYIRKEQAIKEKERRTSTLGDIMPQEIKERANGK